MSDKIKDRKSVFKGFSLADRAVATRTSYAKVTYFHYKKQNFGTPTNLRDDKTNITDVEVGLIDADIENLSIGKSFQGAAGSFDLTLLPSKNWKKILSAGDWILIYLYNEFQDQSIPKDTKNCVMLANIDRVSRSLERGDEDDDKVNLRFKVSGRGFGKVFEDLDMWYDPYTEQVATLDVVMRNAGLEIFGTPTEMVNNIINIMLGQGGMTSAGKTSDLQSWRIPNQLAAKLGSSEGFSFNDVLSKDIRPSVGFKDRELLTLESNGALWDWMKRNSNSLVNELYVEEVRNPDKSITPTVVLKPRPINTPFLDSLSRGADLTALENCFQTLQDLGNNNFIEIAPHEIKFEDLGKDDHSRLNLFWFRTPDNFEKNLSHMANHGAPKTISNPVFIRESIQRHGLKRMDQLIEFCRARSGGVSGSNETRLWRAFMAQLYDMHFANHLYDGGTITCTGVLEAELGKALVIKAPTPKDKDKVYYIEGYEHTWDFQKGWMTTFTLTHGQWLNGGLEVFIDASIEDNGAEDSLLQSSYVAQTGVKR